MLRNLWRLLVGLLIVGGLLAGQDPVKPLAGVGTPSDPDLYSEGKSYAPQLLNLFTAWDFPLVTDEVVIALLDTGLALDHPEFAGRILPGFDVIDNDDDPSDEHGHGTHVAGIALAASDNGMGLAGVCGFCQVLPIRVLNENNHASPAGIAAGLRLAADNGADIVLLSLGKSIGSSLIKEGIDYARTRGLLIVAAAGNNNADEHFFPAAYAGVLAVGATDRHDRRWLQSNFGDFIDVTAPGEAIYSTYPDLENEYGGYLLMSGTSMAAPFVAGLAGLLLAQNPDRTAADLERLLTTTALDLGDPGWDPHFGYGRIDPVAALLAEATNPPPTASLQGTVWYDDNLNHQRELTELIGLAGAPIVLHDEQNRPIGLTNSQATGQWQWTVAAPGTYTITARLPSTILPENRPWQVTVTPTAQLQGLDFGIMRLPTIEAVEAFTPTRTTDTVYLTVRVAPLVQAVQIERAAAADGPYTLIDTQEFDDPSTTSLEWEVADPLPTDLEALPLYYRLQLLPGAVTAGPFVVEPPDGEPGSPPPPLFLPMISN